MNRTSTREEILHKGLVLLLSLVVPALAWGQHKPSGGGAVPIPARRRSQRRGDCFDSIAWRKPIA